MQNSSELDQTFPNTTILEITDLLPFTTYHFTVMACTSVGCTESQPEFVTTLEAGNYLYFHVMRSAKTVLIFTFDLTILKVT